MVPPSNIMAAVAARTAPEVFVSFMWILPWDG
jgi:hypothetical protein